jgi:GntR family transcriptional repressor for pyruvate dehydrogenase complex
MVSLEREPRAESRRVLSDAVADRIQAKILDGTFRPGERLPPERELAEQLQVNRSSLREALKKLEQLRLIAIQRGSGIRVRSPEDASFDLVWAMLFPGGRPNLARIRDLLVREALLPGTLRLALERASAGEIAEAVRLLQRATDPELPDEEFASMLRRLEEDLACMSGNQILLLLSNSLGGFMGQAGFRPATLVLARNRQPLFSAMRRLAVALEARDAGSAERAGTELWRRVTRGILGGLEAPGA